MFNFNSILFLVLPFFGFVVLNRVSGITNIIYLIPFSCVFGIAGFLVLLYLFTYFFGIFKGALISFIILFIISILIFCFSYKEKKFKAFKVQNPLSLKDIIILTSICLFILIFTTLLTGKWIILDFHFHLSFAGYFLKTDKFPTGVPNWPSLFIPYHYAFDLLAATVSKLTAIDIINSFQLIAIIFSVITFLSGYAIAYYFLEAKKRTNDALIGALFFYFCGNLLWLDALFKYLLKVFPVQNDWSLFKTLCALGMHGSIMNDLASSGIIFPSNTIGLSLFLLLIFLYFQFLNTEQKPIAYQFFGQAQGLLLLSIFIVALALFHTSEYMLYLFILALIFSPFLSLIIKDGYSFKSLALKSLTLLFLFGFIILFNGQVFKLLSRGYSYMPDFLEFSINPNLFSLEVFGRYGNVNEHRIISIFSWDFISEFGIQFIFFIFVIYWIVKERFKFSSFILSFFLVSFISPFFLYLKSSPAEVVRMFHPAYEILTMLFGLWIFIPVPARSGPSFGGKAGIHLLKTVIKLLSLLVIIPSIMTLIMSGIFSPGIYLDHPTINYVDYSLKEFSKDKNIRKFFKNTNNFVKLLKKGLIVNNPDFKVAEYLKKHSKDNEYGLSLHPLPFDYIGLPCYTARGSTMPRRISFVTLLKTMDPYLLRELKIKWLFLDPKTVKMTDLDLIEELLNKGFLKEKFAIQYPLYDNIKFKLFKFVDLDGYLKSTPRKSYWTVVRYLGTSVIALPDQYGKQTIFMFNSEKEATDFLMEQMKVNPALKKSWPFIDAVGIDVLQQQAKEAGFNLVLL